MYESVPRFGVDVGWSHCGGSMLTRHGVNVEQAVEALGDPDALVFDPDHRSQSGHSVRTIGWSPSAGRLLTVITIADAGVVCGVNGWPANDVDARRYRTDGPSGDDDDR